MADAEERLLLVAENPATGTPALADVLTRAARPFTFWQGISDPRTHLCMLEAGGDRTHVEPNAWQKRLSRFGKLYTLALIDRLGGAAIDSGPVANFVMRTLEPDIGAGLIPAILDQADLILDGSDCLGFALFSVDHTPSNLLGVTAWPELAAFESYAAWAKSHVWVDVIGPRTISVPLRLLARIVS